MRTLFVLYAIAFLMIGVGEAVSGELYKCKSAQGRISYSDFSCQAGMKEEKHNIVVVEPTEPVEKQVSVEPTVKEKGIRLNSPEDVKKMRQEIAQTNNLTNQK